jgi:hypothetical protein
VDRIATRRTIAHGIVLPCIRTGRTVALRRTATLLHATLWWTISVRALIARRAVAVGDVAVRIRISTVRLITL